MLAFSRSVKNVLASNRATIVLHFTVEPSSFEFVNTAKFVRIDGRPKKVCTNQKDFYLITKKILNDFSTDVTKMGIVCSSAVNLHRNDLRTAHGRCCFADKTAEK